MIPDDLQPVLDLLADFRRPWAICGGWAIDLFLNHLSRPHKDVDLTVRRRDQTAIFEYLVQRGWNLQVAEKGHLRPWDGQWLNLPLHILWCQNADYVPDFIEVMFSETDETDFIYRRNAAIRLRWQQAWLRSPGGIPILAPEIVLLYKSKGAEDECPTADFHSALPHLRQAQRRWLRDSLRLCYEDHPWLPDLESMIA